MTKLQRHFIRQYVRDSINIYNKEELIYRIRLRFVAYGIEQSISVATEEINRIEVLTK